MQHKFYIYRHSKERDVLAKLMKTSVGTSVFRGADSGDH
jgi:hypothetical protein